VSCSRLLPALQRWHRLNPRVFLHLPVALAVPAVRVIRTIQLLRLPLLRHMPQFTLTPVAYSIAISS